MQFDDLEHWLDIVLGHCLPSAARRAVLVAGKGSPELRQPRALLVSVAGHDRSDRARQGAAFIGIVAEAVAHDQRAKIGIAEPEGAEDVANSPRSP